MSEEARYGVLIINTGTPDAPTPRAVRSYLREFLMDPYIVPMNKIVWWLILHLFILPRRGRVSAKKYQKIWTEEGSPLVVAHKKLASGVENAFRQTGYENLRVRAAMNYGNPSLLSAIQSLQAEGCDRLIVLPTYPQSAYATTEAVRGKLDQVLKKAHFEGDVDFTDNYHDNPTYLRAIAESIKHAGFDPGSDDRLLFSFHSIPLCDIEGGDTYELQVDASCLQIASDLGIERNRWTIGYACRFDKEREWLSPYSVNVLRRWGEAGAGRVFMVCPGFAADCLETLYEIPYELEPEYRAARKKAGLPCAEDDFRYVLSLNATKAHVKVLVDVLRPHVEGGDL